MGSLRWTRILMNLLLASVLVSTPFSTGAASTSTKLLNFMEIFGQEFDNQWQIEEDEKYGRPAHNHLRVLHIPVKVPALSSDNTLLVLELVENQVKRLHVALVTEDPDGIIRSCAYDIINTDKFSVDNVDSIDLSGLQNLKLEDLREWKECERTYSEIEPNVFFGLRPDCRDQRNGVIPQYQLLFTCNALSGFSHPGELERPSRVPYIMKSQRRFPLLPELLAGVPNYSSPCPEN